MPTGGDGTAYMGEKMDLKKADMGDVITDFRKSDAPQFKGCLLYTSPSPRDS